MLTLFTPIQPLLLFSKITYSGNLSVLKQYTQKKDIIFFSDSLAPKVMSQYGQR